MMRESKLESATANATTGDMGELMSILNLDSVTFPNTTISGPLLVYSSIKFLIDAHSTLPRKFSMYPPMCSSHTGFRLWYTSILSLLSGD
jgi:hypothetical protein